MTTTGPHPTGAGDGALGRRTRPRMDPTTRLGLVVSAAVVAVPLVVIAVLAVVATPSPVVTYAIAEDGTATTLAWRDHPGQAGTSVDDVLAAPSLEEGVAEGEATVAEMTAAITDRLGLEWAPAPASAASDTVDFATENGWGGPSMLRGVNLPTWQTRGVPRSWEGKEEAIAILGEVAARHGWSEPSLDQERWPRTPEELIADTGGATPEEQVVVTGGIQGPHGLWVMFAFTDLALDDAEGTFASRYAVGSEAGWEPSSLTLSYGANGLLPAAGRAEFERRAEPFRAQPQPAALPSD